jgi:hypothetical protein
MFMGAIYGKYVATLVCRTPNPWMTRTCLILLAVSCVVNTTYKVINFIKYHNY